MRYDVYGMVTGCSERVVDSASSAFCKVQHCLCLVGRVRESEEGVKASLYEGI
jgi:hypothetical protein